MRTQPWTSLVILGLATAGCSRPAPTPAAAPVVAPTAPAPAPVAGTDGTDGFAHQLALADAATITWITSLDTLEKATRTVTGADLERLRTNVVAEPLPGAMGGIVRGTIAFTQAGAPVATLSLRGGNYWTLDDASTPTGGQRAELYEAVEALVATP